tara:strand:+ start:1499 stop:1879 length:381 start_codon:yes stop_codon:yes gene_type:complete
MDLMEIAKPKIFVSYTVRDGSIGVVFLNKIFDEICGISEVYIDLIHNDSTNKQDRVIKELNNSDFIFLIRTEQIDNSEWVDKEISLAKKLNIPIIEFEYQELIEKKIRPITQAINNLTLRDKTVYS